MESTGAKCITKTIQFYHHKVVLPQINQVDCILKVTRELNRAIINVAKDAPPDYIDAVKNYRKYL
eukprot:7484046-Ditylum_brightwellii.AAC.2